MNRLTFATPGIYFAPELTRFREMPRSRAHFVECVICGRHGGGPAEPVYPLGWMKSCQRGHFACSKCGRIGALPLIGKKPEDALAYIRRGGYPIGHTQHCKGKFDPRLVNRHVETLMACNDDDSKVTIEYTQTLSTRFSCATNTGVDLIEAAALATIALMDSGHIDHYRGKREWKFSASEVKRSTPKERRYEFVLRAEKIEQDNAS